MYLWDTSTSATSHCFQVLGKVISNILEVLQVVRSIEEHNHILHGIEAAKEKLHNHIKYMSRR